MMFKAAIIALAVVTTMAGALWWDRGRIADKLEVTEARLQSAELDAAIKAETITVLRIHSRQLDELRAKQRDAETIIRNSEGFDDETPAIILDAICSVGMC